MTPMQHLPVSLDVRGRAVLVVGGGEVAVRKAAFLLRAGADVVVVAKQPGRRLVAMQRDGKVRLERAAFRPAHVHGKALVVAATDNAFVNRSAHESARALNIPVNVVDEPALCTFIFPAVVDRSPVTIAISTGGASPVLARALKARIERLVPSAYGRLAGLFATFRNAVKLRFRTVDERRRFWEAAMDGPAVELALAGRDREAKAALQAQLAAPDRPQTGEVFLVGAGPGDPDLLTIKAARLLHRADIVYYDRLVAPEILDYCRRDAEFVFVGKAAGCHSVPQHDICRALVDAAGRGQKVVRLKGGDPFVFGRGGEEIQALAAAGVPFQVVPGITAASGCGAYAGIPLTHRDCAQSVTFITGHTRDGQLEIDWPRFAAERQTLVFYMGLGNAREITAKLTQHGRAGSTPAAVIENGTTAKQRVLVASLATLAEVIEKERVGSPSLLIVGDVVALQQEMAWFTGGRAAPVAESSLPAAGVSNAAG